MEAPANNGLFRYVENRIKLALRYEYILGANLFNANSRFATALGFSGSPQFAHRALNPVESFAFGISQTMLGFNISVTPRLEYAITNHFYFDLNIPLSLADYTFYTSSYADPTLPIPDRRTNTSEFETFPAKFLVRFGLGLKI